MVPHAWVVVVVPLEYGSEDATTVTVLLPGGVTNDMPLLQPETALTAAREAAAAMSKAKVLHAPVRINRRRMLKSPIPRMPASHHGSALWAGELGGLFTTIVKCVVNGG